MAVNHVGKDRIIAKALSIKISAFCILLLQSAIGYSNTPICQLANSDPDNDGWGWENNASCIVQANSSTTAGSNNNFTSCAYASSDHDGDGWGWENNTTCKVVSATRSQTPDTPGTSNASNTIFCQYGNSDPDGDGYGWENNASCRANGSNQTGQTSYSPADITDLILITGQSNTLGFDTTYDYALDAPHSRVFAYTNKGWKVAELYQSWDGPHPGPGNRYERDKIHNNFALHFGKRLAALDQNTVVGFILVSEPGEGIEHWNPGNTGMLRVQQKSLQAINALPHKSSLDGILWHQGETDWQYWGTSDPDVHQPAPGNYYPIKLRTLIHNLRTENWFDSSKPFICGETIKAHGVNGRLNSLNTDPDPKTACVRGAGLSAVDDEAGSHFDAPALRTMGARYAERYHAIR